MKAHKRLGNGTAYYMWYADLSTEANKVIKQREKHTSFG